ncbi:MAG: GspE/PulE family protein [Holosporaceae bacterium]
MDRAQSDNLERDFDPFLRFLLNDGLLSIDQAHVLMQEWQLTRKPMDVLCADMAFLSQTTLLQKRALFEGCDRLSKEALLPDRFLVKQLGQKWCEDFFVVPLSLKNNVLHLVMADCTDVFAKDVVQKYFSDAQLQVSLASKRDIAASLRFEKEALHQELLSVWPKLEGLEEKTLSHKLANVLEMFLAYGLEQAASDLHFEPYKAFVRVRCRLDGVLKNLLCFHKRYWSLLLARLKVLCQLDVTKTQQPQHGRLFFQNKGERFDVRVATHPTAYGERLVVRFLNAPSLSLDGLGFEDAVVDQIKDALLHPEGLCLVTGPTGSGKTTTLHAMLRHLSSAEKNTMTLEDPIEYNAPFAAQTAICKAREMDFERGIASSLRQDVDLLLVGEVRDDKTAQMAMRAAMTGHQVLTSIHTPDALSAIDRLLDLGVLRTLLADYLRCLVSQRLLRLLCPLCKEASQDVPKPFLKGETHTMMFYQKRGCEACGGTGYKGRVPVAEVVLCDETLKDALLKGGHRSTLYRCVQMQQTTSLWQSARGLLLKGLVSFDECVRVLGAFSLDAEVAPWALCKGKVV